MTPAWLTDLLAPAPPYNDGGAGAYNAEVLRRASVRPAFFDVSCLMYRLIYAKASTYCAGGADDSTIAHRLASDTLRDVAEACTNFACAPVLTFDSHNSLRKALFDGYKSGRGGQRKTASEETVLRCKPEAMRLLHGVYCPAYKVQGFLSHGYESDDIIADFVLGLKQQCGDEPPAFAGLVVVVSSDHDLHQVLLPGTRWADVVHGVMMTPGDVTKRTGVAPEDVVAAKVIGGCKSDAIPGIPGCGDKTVEQVLTSRSANVKLARARNAMLSDEGADIAERNERLIRLPFSSYTPQRLCWSVWPQVGVPDEAADMMTMFGVEKDMWAMFGDVTSPTPPGSIPMCRRGGCHETELC